MHVSAIRIQTLSCLAACAFEAMTVQRCLFLNDYDISCCKLEIAVSTDGECKLQEATMILIVCIRLQQPAPSEHCNGSKHVQAQQPMRCPCGPDIAR